MPSRAGFLGAGIPEESKRIALPDLKGKRIMGTLQDFVRSITMIRSAPLGCARMTERRSRMRRAFAAPIYFSRPWAGSLTPPRGEPARDPSALPEDT